MSAVVPLPAANIEAEASLIGACFLSPKAIETCSEILDGHEFYRESNAVIYRACVKLWERGVPVDAITVVNELTKTKLLSAANGEDNVYDIAASALTQSNAGHYAKIIREMWLLREAGRVGAEITSLALSREGTVEEIVSQADGLVLDLTNKLEHKKDSVYTSKQLVEDFKARMSNPEKLLGGVETPFPSFLRPWKPGRLYVLGGYSKDGKTAVATQALRAACEGGSKVGFASIEMTKSDLTDRLVATFGVPLGKILEGNLNHYNDVVDDALSQIESWNFEVSDDAELDAHSIKRFQRRGRYDFLIVDHLHRIRIKDKRHEREETAENMRQITNLAKTAEVPILLLVQLARGYKDNPYPRPSQESGRGTSAIENEASMVFFVWRLRDKDGRRTENAELIVAANRYGAEDFRNLNFRSSFVRYDLSVNQTGGM